VDTGLCISRGFKDLRAVAAMATGISRCSQEESCVVANWRSLAVQMMMRTLVIPQPLLLKTNVCDLA